MPERRKFGIRRIRPFRRLVPGPTRLLGSPTVSAKVQTLSSSEWRKMAVSFYKYKVRESSRKPKFHSELSFLNSVPAEMLHYVTHKF